MTRSIAPPAKKTASAPRKTRSDGARSRHAILQAAAQLATTRGLAGLSIGDLAEHIGMSKSGLYAHFDSKEALELATIEAAAEIFQISVVAPAIAAPPGTKRLIAIAEAYISHLEHRVFPGGCFFAAIAAELDTRPGRARDRVVEVITGWLSLLESCVRDAQSAGEIDPAADAAQIAFEADAMLALGNIAFVLFGDPKTLGRARRGFLNVLTQYAHAAPAKKPRRRS